MTRDREMFFCMFFCSVFPLEEEKLWGDLDAAFSCLVGREGIGKVLLPGSA